MPEPLFKDQINGRSAAFLKLLKDGGSSKDNEIDGISGATISSKAIVNAVNAALDFFHSMIKGA